MAGLGFMDDAMSAGRAASSPPLVGVGRGRGTHTSELLRFDPSPLAWSASRPKPARGVGESDLEHA
jgi:hypothetical protein